MEEASHDLKTGFMEHGIGVSTNICMPQNRAPLDFDFRYGGSTPR